MPDPMTLTPEQIAAMQEAVSKATSSELCVDNFVVHPGDGGGQWFVYDAEEDDGPLASFDNEGDARFFVAARTFVPAALATLAQLRAENERLRGALQMVVDRLPICGDPRCDLSLTGDDWERVIAALAGGRGQDNPSTERPRP